MTTFICTLNSSGGRSTQIFYLSKSITTTMQKYSVTKKSIAFNILLKVCKIWGDLLAKYGRNEI